MKLPFNSTLLLATASAHAHAHDLTASIFDLLRLYDEAAAAIRQRVPLP